MPNFRPGEQPGFSCAFCAKNTPNRRTRQSKTSRKSACVAALRDDNARMATKIAPDFDYTNEELLPLVREAIAVVTKYGRSYTIGNRVFNREHLPELYEILDKLERKISRVVNGLAYNNARIMRKPH